MESTIEVIKYIVILTIIFLVVYLPIEKLAKNKAWYFRGCGLLLVAILSFLYSEYLGWRIECYLEGYDMKCGFTHTVVSFFLALFFALMGVVWLIKDRFFGRLKNEENKSTTPNSRYEVQEKVRK